MKNKLNIAFFGSSLVSAYWNGAATYYRGIISALHAHGHAITFYEPDALDRQRHRDMPDPPYARSVVYAGEGLEGVRAALREAREADIVIKCSGVGVFDDYLEHAVLELRRAETLVLFWDVDAPATLDRVRADREDPFRGLIPAYDLILSYGGGPAVVQAYEALGARQCVPIYNALDPMTHHPVPADPRFEGDLVFMGNRLPDRESRVMEFFFKAARLMPERRFLLGGNGWERGAPELPNVTPLGHVYTADHNALNASARAVLNVDRESMARYGYSPPTRIFEAAGAGACIITDAWEGIEDFLEPDEECLVATGAEEVCAHLRGLTPVRALWIGQAARQRVLREHTYYHRATQFERLLDAVLAERKEAVS